MVNCFQVYFSLYCKFLSKDLVNSFDPLNGRNSKIIDSFYRAFFVLTGADYSIEDKNATLTELSQIISEYLDNLTNEDMCMLLKKHLECSSKDFNASFNLIQNNTKVNFGYFVSAQKDFNTYRIDKNHILKQGLIEFNNAISHLYAGVKAGNDFLISNISKANTHFYRGALDYYKTIIKDNFQRLTPEQRTQLVTLRIDELNCVGVDVANKAKREGILQRYQALVISIFT